MTTTTLDKYLDAWLKHHDRNPSTCEGMLAGSAHDLVYEDVPTAMVFQGHDGVRAICGNSPGWVDEIRLTVVDKQFDGSRWTVEWEASGTDSTAKRPFHFRGASLGTIDDDGKVNSHRDYWDRRTLMDQVATPESLPDEVQFGVTRQQANMVLELVTRASENGAASVDELDELSKLLSALSYGEHLQG
jgi:SnoaL-like domain